MPKITTDAAIEQAEAWRKAAEPGLNRLWQVQSPSWGGGVFEVVVLDGDDERKAHVETREEVGETLVRLIGQG